MALAGLTQSTRSVRRWLRLDPVADRSGAVVVYPAAIAGKWSYWRGGGVLRDNEEIDDVGFVAGDDGIDPGFGPRGDVEMPDEMWKAFARLRSPR